MQIIYAVLSALLVFCGAFLFAQYQQRRKREESVRARLTTDGMAPEEDTPINLQNEPSAQAKAILAFLHSFGVNVEAVTRKLQLRFAHAGINSPDAPAYYLLYERVISLGVLVIAAFIALRAKGDWMMYLVALIVAVIGVYGAKLYLQNKIDHRKKKLQRAFPDTLDLLLICVESGLALDASLNRVCSELGRAYPEITSELNRTRLELALLNDRVRALTNLGERTNMVAFRSLVSSLVQSERFGTSLTDTLRVLSEEFRLQRLTDAEVKAARLPVIMTIPLMFFLMPAFFLIVLGPAIVSFVNDGSEVTGKK